MAGMASSPPKRLVTAEAQRSTPTPTVAGARIHRSRGRGTHQRDAFLEPGAEGAAQSAASCRLRVPGSAPALAPKTTAHPAGPSCSTPRPRDPRLHGLHPPATCVRRVVRPHRGSTRLSYPGVPGCCTPSPTVRTCDASWFRVACHRVTGSGWRRRRLRGGGANGTTPRGLVAVPLPLLAAYSETPRPPTLHAASRQIEFGGRRSREPDQVTSGSLSSQANPAESLGILITIKCYSLHRESATG